MHQLEQRIEKLAGTPAEDLRTDAARATFLEFREALTRGEKNAIIIVGAGHLVGKEGVVELLKKDGLKVTQE